jgi:hypothetical protein
VLSYRDADSSNKGRYLIEKNIFYLFNILGIKYFPFMSVHHWGEYPIGRWTLRMETRESHNKDSIKSAMTYKGPSELSYFGLRIYGSNDPDKKNDVQREKRNRNLAFTPTENEIHSIYKRELAIRQSPHVIEKRNYDQLLKERQLRKQNEIEQDESVFQHFRRVFGF